MNSDSTRQGGLPWNFLTPREKQFLELIYQVDVEARNFKRRRALSQKKCVVYEQNWSFYSDDRFDRFSRLKQMMFRANLVDEETYSTFSSLEQRGLIESSDCADGINIRLTNRGYEVVGIGDKLGAESLILSKYELNESAWCVLACACMLPAQFVSASTGKSLLGKTEVGLSCDVLSQEVLKETLKALNIFFLPLVERYKNWVRATEFGQIFYVEQYSYYSARYPAIAAPMPAFSKADVMERLKLAGDLPKLVRLKRYEKSLNEAVTAIGAPGITPTVLYRLEQGQLDIPQALSPTQIKAIRRWIETD